MTETQRRFADNLLRRYRSPAETFTVPYGPNSTVVKSLREAGFGFHGSGDDCGLAFTRLSRPA